MFHSKSGLLESIRGSTGAEPSQCDAISSLTAKGLRYWRYADADVALTCARSAAENADPNAGVLLVLLLTQLRRTAEAEAALERYVAPEEPCHRRTAVLLLRANIRLAQGRYPEALSLTTDGMAQAEHQDDRSLVPLGNLVMTTVSLRLNDLRTALRSAQLLSEDALYGRLPLIGADAAWIAAQVTRVQRGPEEACDAMAAVVESALHDTEVFLSQPAAAPVLARYALELGSIAAAERIVQQADAVAIKNAGFPGLKVSAAHAAALLNEAPDALRSATADHADPWARALAAEDLGLLLAARPNERAAGIRSFEQALEAYDAIGSLHDFARVKARLRDLRDNRRRPASARPKQSSAGRSGLTVTEVQVAGLVSQGLTNRQVANQIYLSRHTVAYHLKSIFGKLGVSSRGELTSMWPQLIAQDD